MKKLHLLVLLLFTSLSVFSQNQEWIAHSNEEFVIEAWIRNYGNGRDYSTDLAVDSEGNVYVTGFSGSYPNYDYATIKYNSSGDTVWVTQYNGPGNGLDGAKAIAVDESGNVYVTGYSHSGTSSEFATIKYNSSGATVWIARYSGPENLGADPAALAVDASGNVYVTGTSHRPGTSANYATIKYDSGGIEQWVAHYEGPDSSHNNPTALAIDSSGNVYVTGRSLSSHNGDFATIKYNSFGIEQWVAVFNGPVNGYDGAVALAIDAAGNVFVTGYSQSYTAIEYATVKYNSSGAEQWVARYKGSENDWAEPSAIAVDPSGNIYVTGYSIGIGTNYDYATIKYSPSGVEQWIARYNDDSGGSEDFATALAIDASGNIYVTGRSNFDFVTFKYDSLGVKRWVARYNNQAGYWDSPSAIKVDGSGNVYVTGFSMIGLGTNRSVYTTVKYSQNPTSVLDSGTKVPLGFALSQNYPNPFNPSTHIEYALSSQQFVTLKIYDLLGREVAILVEEQKPGGIHRVVFDASRLSSGVYMYRLTAGSFSASGKMVLLR